MYKISLLEFCLKFVPHHHCKGKGSVEGAGSVRMGRSLPLAACHPYHLPPAACSPCACFPTPRNSLGTLLSLSYPHPTASTSRPPHSLCFPPAPPPSIYPSSGEGRLHPRCSLEQRVYLQPDPVAAVPALLHAPGWSSDGACQCQSKGIGQAWSRGCKGGRGDGKVQRWVGCR